MITQTTCWCRDGVLLGPGITAAVSSRHRVAVLARESKRPGTIRFPDGVAYPTYRHRFGTASSDLTVITWSKGDR